MKKHLLKTLLTALVLLVGGVSSAWADDVFKDVTNSYLTNSDFEGEYTVYSNPSNDRAIYQPAGWTISYTSGDPNDMTALNSDCLQWNPNFNGKAQLMTGGNNTYWVRMRWGTGAILELSQTVTLPEGSYRLTANYYKNGTGGDGFILVNTTKINTSVNEDVWKSLSIVFTSDGTTATKIGCMAQHTNTYEKFLAFDNFVLEWNLTNALAKLIEDATEAYNEDTSNTALKSAIDAADEVKDSQEAAELETAYDNLMSVAAIALKRKVWSEAKAAAQVALNNADYANVTGSEKKALENEDKKDEPTTAEGFDAAIEALISATNAFTAAKASYDLFVEYNKVLPYAPNVQPEITDESTAEGLITELRAYYESNALAEGYKGAEDVTSTYLSNYVNPTKIDGWTVNNTTGNSKMRIMTNEPYTNSDGSAATGYFDSDSWGSAFATTFTQDVELPQGVYILSVKARGNGTTTYKVIADDESTDIISIGNTGGVFGRGWDDYTVEFEVKATKTIMLGMQMETGSSSNWLSFSDFRLVRIGDSEEGAVLAEANTLAADDDAVAVGKLRDAIAAYNDGGEIADLAAAVAQFKTDNADQGKDETSKVGTDKEKWTVGTGNNSNRGTYTKNGITLVEHYGESDAGVMISQQVNVDNGLYNIELYATSHNAWNNYGANLQTDADDVAYVFGTSGSNTIKTWITARRNSGMLESEPEVYAVNSLEVNDGKITMGLALDRAGQTEWHTIQIKKLTLVTTAKKVYALDKTEMADLISEANALAANEYKTEGKAALNTAITAAQVALESNKLNISEFEAEIQALKEAIEVFTTANYVAMTGKYYVQNATSGKYMAAGHSWGTQAIVNESGLDMTLSAGADKKVTFDSQVFNGDNNHFLGSNLYMDSSVYAWIIEQTGEDEYTIGNGAKYLGVDASDNLVLVDEAVTWKFLAAADVQSQRLADGLTALEAATADNGVDATFLLKDANFNRNDHRWAAWTVSDNCTNKNLGGGCDASNGNGCAESYHSLFTISQTVNNVPSGVYKMTAQGFFRQDDGVTEDSPLFFAGDKTAEVSAKAGSEGNMGEASVSFSNGQYTIEPIEFIVGEDGVLTVGIKNETAVHQWVIFDNFQLTYYGPAPKATVTLAVTDAQYATFVAPFDVEIPGGVTAYVVEGVDSETNEIVIGEESAISANKPVLLFSDAAISILVEGVAVAAGEEGLSYGRLVGTYEDIDAPNGSYILQNHSGAVAFYRVDTEVATPKVKAYHAYLDVSGDARAYYFGGEATAIGALQALTNGDAEIYDVNGRKQVKLQKGVNIIRTKDGRTQKVMVK